MSDAPDPFEALRDLNPVPPEDVRGAASSPRAQQALEEVLAAGGRDRPRASLHARRPRIAVLVAIAIIAALASAAWVLSDRGRQTPPASRPTPPPSASLPTSPRSSPARPTKPPAVDCYQKAIVTARVVVAPAGRHSPIAACRSVWNRGGFGARRNPLLQACTLRSGAIGVFPSQKRDVCERLKLQSVAPTG